MIRQENEIVIVNDENEERKLSLCKTIKFNKGLQLRGWYWMDAQQGCKWSSRGGHPLTVADACTAAAAAECVIHRLQKPALNPPYALLPERGKHATW